MQSLMKNVVIGLCVTFLFSACQRGGTTQSGAVDSTELTTRKKQIGILLDSFHLAAARADFNGYFKFYTENGTFLGTDATEYWTKKEFMVWAKPFFDNKSTWNFTALDRHIYIGSDPNTAWFDELLDTQMKICRGSGVVTKVGNEWRVEQYVLSMTVPNSQVDSLIPMKAKEEDVLIAKLKGKK